MMTEEQAIADGIEIARRVARTFYWGNRHAYRKIPMDPEDLEGYLHDAILFRKYLPLVRLKPEYYSPDSFGRSLYSSCRKAMLSHVKRHITSQKRGTILLPGTAVELDRELSEGFTPQVARDDSDSMMRRVRSLADECGDPVAKRVILLLAKEKYESKAQIRKRLRLHPKRFEQLWQTVQAMFSDFVTTSEKTLYEPTA